MVYRFNSAGWGLEDMEAEIRMRVIAVQSWHTARILGPLPKIRGVTKKRHGHNNEF